jgi:hypothetical protein
LIYLVLVLVLSCSRIDGLRFTRCPAKTQPRWIKSAHFPQAKIRNESDVAQVSSADLTPANPEPRNIPAKTQPRWIKFAWDWVFAGIKLGPSLWGQD